MHRYYFDLRDKDGSYRHETGLELPDMDAAIAEARRALADMTRELVADGAHSDIEIMIRDGDDGPVRVAISLWTDRSVESGNGSS